MKDKTIQIDSKLQNAVTLGKTVFRINRTYQSSRPVATAFSAHIHKVMNPTITSL